MFIKLLFFLFGLIEVLCVYMNMGVKSCFSFFYLKFVVYVICNVVYNICRGIRYVCIKNKVFVFRFK